MRRKSLKLWRELALPTNLEILIASLETLWCIKWCKMTLKLKSYHVSMKFSSRRVFHTSPISKASSDTLRDFSLPRGKFFEFQLKIRTIFKWRFLIFDISLPPNSVDHNTKGSSSRIWSYTGKSRIPFGIKSSSLRVAKEENKDLRDFRSQRRLKCYFAKIVNAVNSGLIP